MNKYLWVAFSIVFLVLISYFVNFYIILGYEISSDSSVWGTLGDYVGGILNPSLSFISIVLLIKSLTLQNEANLSLREELKNTERIERLRSFEILFFNMVESQRKLFDSFKIVCEDNDALREFIGSEAVIKIESDIDGIRMIGGGDDMIRCHIESLDHNDQIFGLLRAFYVTVMVISDKLSDQAGFGAEDRRSYYQTLINFTDFSFLRMVLINVQFMDYESSKYLRNLEEFKDVIRDLGLDQKKY